MNGHLQHFPVRNEIFSFSPLPLLNCIKYENLTLFNQFIQFARETNKVRIDNIDAVYNALFRSESTSPEFVRLVLSNESMFDQLLHEDSVVCLSLSALFVRASQQI